MKITFTISLLNEDGEITKLTGSQNHVKGFELDFDQFYDDGYDVIGIEVDVEENDDERKNKPKKRQKNIS